MTRSSATCAGLFLLLLFSGTSGAATTASEQKVKLGQVLLKKFQRVIGWKRGTSNRLGKQGDALTPQQLVLKNSAARELSDAKYSMKEGHMENFRTRIAFAQKYSHELGASLDEAMLQEMTLTALKNAIALKLADAKFSMKEGHMENFRTRIAFARQYSRELGTSLDEAKLEEMKLTALKNSIALKLSDAKYSMKNGYKHAFDSHLHWANVYARELGVRVDEQTLKIVE